MIKGIAFDLEGTLFDVELAHRAHVAVASEAGLHLRIEEAISTIPSFVGGSDIQVLREISEKAGVRGHFPIFLSETFPCSEQERSVIP